MEVLGNENVPPGDTESDEADQPMATNFRAKPVPEHTSQPVFQNMVREQPKRFVSDCEIPLKDSNQTIDLVHIDSVTIKAHFSWNFRGSPQVQRGHVQVDAEGALGAQHGQKPPFKGYNGVECQERDSKANWMRSILKPNE